jgi:hypothetical protein
MNATGEKQPQSLILALLSAGTVFLVLATAFCWAHIPFATALYGLIGLGLLFLCGFAMGINSASRRVMTAGDLGIEQEEGE